MGPSTHTASPGDWWESGRAALVREGLERGAERREIVLDVGCGSGYVISDAVALGGRLKVGIDAWRWSSWNPADRSVFVVADVMQLPFRSGIADAALSLDVIEHLADDRTALDEIARVLRPGGLAVLTVPAFTALWSKHDDAVGHYRRYRLRDLITSLENAGFSVVRRSYFFLWLFPLALVRRVVPLGGRSGETPRFLGPVAGPLGSLERWCIRHQVVLPFGSSLFIEAANRMSPASREARHRDRQLAGSG